MEVMETESIVPLLAAVVVGDVVIAEVVFVHGCPAAANRTRFPSERPTPVRVIVRGEDMVLGRL